MAELIPINPIEVSSYHGPPRARKLPGFFKRAANFASAYIKHASSGSHRVSEEVAKERFDICNTCPLLLRGEDGKHKCSACGCPIKQDIGLLSKLSWASSSCPKGKWGPV